MPLNSLPAYSHFRTIDAGRAYNEAAFRHFLAIERRRADRSMRSLYLALGTIRGMLRPYSTFTDAASAALFAGLQRSVREVDFVGWYRERRIAGAVLAQGADLTRDMQRRMATRIVQALTLRLSTDQARQLHVRVLRIGGRFTA